jgi:hypothetical protein
MKSKLIAAVSAGAAAVAAVTLIAGVAAVAAPAIPPAPTPTVPYPATPKSDDCAVEAATVTKQQDIYDFWLNRYNKYFNLYKKGAASQQTLYQIRESLDAAVLALDNARYALAKCQNDTTTKNKCVDLNLVLNQDLDELLVYEDLQMIAQFNYDGVLTLYNEHKASEEQLEEALSLLKVAKDNTNIQNAKISSQKKALAKANCGADPRPPAPPTPAPTKSSTPTSSPSPTPTTSGSPTPTLTPRPSTSTTTPVAS